MGTPNSTRAAVKERDVEVVSVEVGSTGMEAIGVETIEEEAIETAQSVGVEK